MRTLTPGEVVVVEMVVKAVVVVGKVVVVMVVLSVTVPHPRQYDHKVLGEGDFKADKVCLDT